MHNQRLEYLFKQQIAGTITAEEEGEFGLLIEEPALREQLEKLIDKLLIESPGINLPEENIQATLQAIFNAQPSKLVPLQRKMYWLRIAVAAAVIIAITSIALFVTNDRRQNKSSVDIVNSKDVSSPQNNKAKITLADGRMVSVDSLDKGLIAEQGNVKLVKLADGQIVYQTSDGLAKAIQYNTLSNPRGSKIIDMMLTDGSHVWLNAGSSIKYPVAFAGNDRKVEMTGEAYFEIAHDASKPFYVTRGEVEVKVLGTHFNVNAYDDEANIQVTLLEGSVRVSHTEPGTASQVRNEQVTLKPGQQGIVAETGNGNIQVSSNVNLDKVMAWKNGRFQFEGAGIEEVMRQLSRWYNVEVKYEGPLPKNKFNGKIGKTLTLDQLLKGLATTGIHYKIEGGNKITITQ